MLAWTKHEDVPKTYEQGLLWLIIKTGVVTMVGLICVTLIDYALGILGPLEAIDWRRMVIHDQCLLCLGMVIYAKTSPK